MRILVIEDDPDTSCLTAFTLTRQGHDVREVSSFREAIEAASEGAYDVFIADVNLPDSGGVDIAARLKQIQNRPVIALSGMSEDHVASRASFDAYLTKPVPAERLEQTVIRFASGP